MLSNTKKKLPFAGLILFALCSTNLFAQNASDNPVLDTIVTPDLERRTITEDQLDSEDWEVGVYTGIFSIEDFGTNSVNGLRVAYHMTEDFTIELNYGLTKANESSIEVLGGGIQLLSDDQREYSYYNISVLYNIFQGEVFFGHNTAYNTGFYILLGGGNTTFNENDYYTYTIGGGLRFYFNDWVALHATAKDHIFKSDIVEEKFTNNLEYTLGLSIYF